MELVYMWIKDYGHLKNIGFNFGGKDLFQIKRTEIDRKGYTITYEMEITKKQNLYYINNFFNSIESKANIINVTAIIGENGAGKSTILEIIRSINSGTGYGFFILKKGEKHFRTKIMNSNNVKYHFSGFPLEELTNENKLKFERIYFSNMFQTSAFKQYNKVDPLDLSTLKYLYENKYKNKPLETALSEYSLEELNRQMDFVSNFYKIITDDFKYSLPSVITILDSHPIQSDEYGIDNEKIDRIIKKLKSNEAKKLLKNIDFSSYIKKTFDYKIHNFPTNLHKIMKSIFLQWLLNIINSEELKSGNLLKTIIEYSNSSEEFYTYLRSSQNEHINILLDIFEILVKIAYNYHKDSKPFTYSATNNVFGNFVKDEDKESFFKLVKLQKKTDYTSNLLQFKWSNMSSGEVAILTLFSRFHSIKHKIQSKNILILLDEPDMYLHPSWVQKFINIFIEYLKKDFLGKTIQIILTSNKPICTSDLPAQNVVRLIKTGIDEKTNWPLIEVQKNDTFKSFGANIYSLYKDGFFLNEGFIGLFAKRKIQDVINWLNDKYNSENSDYIKEIIQIIDEPVLKEKLNMMFSNKMERINDKNSP